MTKAEMMKKRKAENIVELLTMPGEKEFDFDFEPPKFGDDLFKIVDFPPITNTSI
jgi:hypothetical protein